MKQGTQRLPASSLSVGLVVLSPLMEPMMCDPQEESTVDQYLNYGFLSKQK
jgi:hypothetical protein